jgi:hypothetical protein
MIPYIGEYTLENNKLVLDISGWRTLTIQVIGLGGTMSLLATNDAGAITGSSDGGPRDAQNFNAVQAVNLTTGAAATAVTGTTLFRIDPISFRYLQIGDGSSATATKVLVFYSTPV